MKGKKWNMGKSIGIMIGLLSMSLTGCGGQDQSYDQAAIEAEINRMIAEGKLIDVAEMDAFDEQALEMIENSDLPDIFEGETGTDQGEGKLEFPEKASTPEFVASNGPDTIEIDEETYYRLGTEQYPAGEYIFIADTEYGGYTVRMDDSEHTIVAIDTGYYKVFDTLNGQYISWTDGKIYPIDKAPTITKTEKGAYPEGRYKVGVQIPAGEYVVKGDYVSLTSYMGLSEQDSAAGYCSSVRSAIIKVNDGQYLEAYGSDLYPLEATADLKPADGIYKEGTYKVGIHMPPGTYCLKTIATSAYAQIFNDAYMLGREDELALAEPETTFTVEEGQYVIITGGEAVAQ